jgi:hypothetical protein
MDLQVFENRALRRIFEPKRKEVTGGWRKLHDKDIIMYIPHQLLLE